MLNGLDFIQYFSSFVRQVHDPVLSVLPVVGGDKLHVRLLAAYFGLHRCHGPLLSARVLCVPSLLGDPARPVCGRQGE